MAFEITTLSVHARTVIATDAINMIPGVDAAGCRTPQIMADAAHAVLVRAGTS